ncbi:hypothetical protein FAZ69_20155 [Trinickia terrae]|uniref:Type III secretion protein n=1 Tax=Trinickia terrae TaxID=2571161 RepID=A0A4U1I1A2_9BURK|nr:type III secretion protein HrpB4 [Trinickia terrae]TKC86937.1 hypothetical protein FAZ69_20155 [Trinickia terrae]
MMEAAPSALAARLVEHHRLRRTLFEWMHPQRLAGVPYAECVRGREARETAALAEAFLDEIGMAAPPLTAFGPPDAALAQLPVRECLTVFRLRALFERVEEVRAWIDRPRRNLLADWVGPHGVRLLLAPRRALAGKAAPLTRHRPLDAADGDALTWLGFRLFERECGWAPDGPLAILQLAMPADASQLALAAGLEGNPGRLSASRLSMSGSILSQLPNLFPEWSW